MRYVVGIGFDQCHLGGKTMGDVIGGVLRVISDVLIELINWISEDRMDSINEGWAWPILACLTVGVVFLFAALWFGHPWMYRLMFGAFLGALALVCIAALVSSPSHRI